MKKMIIMVVFLLMCGMMFAQQAPENLGIRNCYRAGQCVQVSFFWDVIDDPTLDHYDVYWDDDLIETLPNTYHYYQMMDILEFTSYEYHTATVTAIYSGGESESSSICFYLSENHYAVPDDITVTYNLGDCSSLIEWDEPVNGGPDAPLIEDYNIYLDGICVGATEDLYFQLDNMIHDQSYIVGIVVNYNDGLSSLPFHPMLRKEIYFSEFAPPEEIAINETTGLLSWHVPGDGDVIGGTIMHMVAPMLWGLWWTYFDPPPEDPWYFGDGNNYVGFRWGFGAWVHNTLPEDMEMMYAEGLPLDIAYGSTDATAITQITDASSLDFSIEWTCLYDADTSPDGYGDFVVLKNNETNYYGAFQVLDIYECPLMQGYPALLYNCNWWFQTNGSGDFSSASRYYPLYYNIYLDGVCVDSVDYELSICVDEEMVLIDSTLTPGSPMTPRADFEYQFENLVNGQSYTGGIEAVYKVGSSDIEIFGFTYNGIGVDDPPAGVSRAMLSNYPNPFNQHTNISFNITKPGHVTLDVYNIKGEKVKTLVDESLEATDYTIEWNGTDNTGKSVANGVYLYRMSVDDKKVMSNKMILMK